MEGQSKAVELLLAHGANPNTTFNGKSLIDALRRVKNDPAMVRRLEEAGKRQSGRSNQTGG